MKIGIDIGNVIIGGQGVDTQFFTEDYLSTPVVEGTAEAISHLTHMEHEIFLISKCGPEVEKKTMNWLIDRRFWSFTGVIGLPYFVRHRMDKAPVARALGLDVFIDDRQDIIESMYGIVKHRIAFTSWDQTMAELEEIFAKQG
jgi:hypothetical protein